MTQAAPKGVRVHVAFFGRRNVGKSSLLNALTRQAVSIVSPTPGTTTDPVEKGMELLPLGPVLLIDTAGLDDEGDLGLLRIEKTRRVLDRADIAVLVTDGEWTGCDEGILTELRARNIPTVVCRNKCDTGRANGTIGPAARGTGMPTVRVVETCALDGRGVGELREAILAAAPAEWLAEPTILGDLVGAGEMAVLVVPVDKEAPKGRLILPQAQAIRSLLDADAMCVVVKERGLNEALGRLREPPKLVVTDSQAFAGVAAMVPREVPLTGFSILFARYKGDLAEQVRGACAIDGLRPGDRVLVAEACCHHPIEEDIGRVKLPRWLTRHVGGELRFTHVQGHDFPEDVSGYAMVIHCGACTVNRREVLSRIARCRRQGVPVTNYGLAIAWSLGVFERALEPFPAALEAYRKSRAEAGACR